MLNAISNPFRGRIVNWIFGFVAPLVLVVSPAELHAAATWQFAPRRVGAVIPEVGWVVELPLGSVAGSPEFSFPLQLVYLNVRTQRGAFGDQWFCPQLESTLLPREAGLLVWTTPSGSVLGLVADQRRANRFTDQAEQWSAKVAGVLTTITNAEGWQYTYRSGRLVSVQSPSGRHLEFDYAGSNLRQVTLRDPPSGASRVLITLVHQGNDRLMELLVGTEKHSFSYENGRDGRLATWIRPGAAKPATFEYGPFGILTKVQSSLDEARVFKTEFVKPRTRLGQAIENPRERLKLENHWLLEDSSFTYRYSRDTKDKELWLPNPITLENKLGGKEVFDFASKRGVEAVKNAVGGETKTYYFRAPGKKHDGKLRRVEQGGRVLVENFYDNVTGALIESRDANGVSTFYEYDAPRRGQPVASAAAAGSVETLGAPQPIRVLRGTRKNKELVSTMKYDSHGRLLDKTTPATAETTRFAYNARGELESVTDPFGVRTTVTRDSFGRVTSIVTGEQKQIAEYDENGRVKARKMPDGQDAVFTYDAQGQIQSVSQNGVQVVKYERNLAGSIAAQSDALGRVTKFERDNKGRLTVEHQPNGAVTRYEYDILGRRTTQIDGNSNRIMFEYDAAGRLIKQTNPLGQVLTWKHDAEGRLIQRTNGVQTVKQSYDPKGRVAKIDYGVPGEKVIYQYDSLGRLTKAATPSNSVTYFYDSLHRIIAHQLTRGDRERVIRYSYNGRNQKTSVVLSEKVNAAPADPKSKAANPSPSYRLLQQTEYQYDQTGRLSELKSNGRLVCRYQYDGVGRLLSRAYGNGITGRYAYDGFGRQSRLDFTGGPLLKPLILAYQWDAAGQLLSRTWNDETQFYTYDPSSQLLAVHSIATEGPGDGLRPVAHEPTSKAASAERKLVESYRYDLAGNILEKFEHGVKTAMSYNAGNQLVSSITGDETTLFTYDPAGRLIGQSPSPAAPAPEPKAGTGTTARQFIYGFLDKVLQARRSDGSLVGFDYYPDGQLAAKGPGMEFVTSPAGKKKNAIAGIAEAVTGQSAEADLTPNAAQLTLNADLREELVWDGLALLWRNRAGYASEPHISGGVPAASSSDPQAALSFHLNDILGTTLAVVHPDRVTVAPLTSFGKPLKSSLQDWSASPDKNLAGC